MGEKGAVCDISRGDPSLPRQWRRELSSSLHGGLEGAAGMVSAKIHPHSHPGPHCVTSGSLPIQMQTPGGAFALWPGAQ